MKKSKYTADMSRLKVFTDRFRALVEKQGGISEVVNLTKISRPTISFWYNGQRIPDAEHLIILAKAFNVSADYLLGLDDEMLSKEIDIFKNKIRQKQKAFNNIIDDFLGETYDKTGSN